jgi:hypothetical protein
MPDFENDISKPLAYVSSALNAYQAFDIVFVSPGNSGKEKETPGRKESHSKRYGYPFRAGGLSSNISGLTFRFIYLGIDLEKDLCSLFHLSLSVVCRLIVLQECDFGSYRFLSFRGVYIDPVVATPHHLTNRDCKAALALNFNHTFCIFESNQLGPAIRAVPREWIPGIFALIHF